MAVSVRIVQFRSDGTFEALEAFGAPLVLVIGLTGEYHPPNPKIILLIFILYQLYTIRRAKERRRS